MDVFKTLIHSQPGAVGSTVAITGGSINGTNIGATTPGTGAFTTLSASSTSTLTGTVTTSTITGPATTDLTLSGGSSGASLVLGQGSSGAATFTLPGSGGILATQTRNGQSVIRLTNASTGTGAFANLELVNSGFTGSLYQFGTGYTTSGRFIADSLLLDSGGTGGLSFGASAGNITWYQGGNTVTMRLTATTSNLLIGGTTDISGSGGLKVFGTTASTSTTTGALQVSGGIGAAGAANVGTYYGMVDGVTAPGATVGYAKIYVDTADGDLKVVFGDGTIKTLATDT